jgi:acetate kinase
LRLITCHLGNGCSLSGHSRRSQRQYDHGVHALEGLMMGSRSGSIDPGCSCICYGNRIRALNSLIAF